MKIHEVWEIVDGTVKHNVNDSRIGDLLTQVVTSSSVDRKAG